MMKKTLIIIAAIVVVVVLYGIGAYNGFVTGEEKVTESWSQVENQYQRRADLIPNLVNTVKGYAAHEQETFQAVVDARAKATSMQVNADDAASLAAYQEAQGELSVALGRLMMVAENYPDLKAAENFRTLQAQLEGTENRIATERRNFNNMVKDFNMHVRHFPGNIIASMFGFETKAYFEAEEAAQEVPQVQF